MIVVKQLVQTGGIGLRKGARRDSERERNESQTGESHRVNVMITNSFPAMFRNKPNLRTAVLALAVVIGLAPQASAHAILVSSVPASGDVLAGPAIMIQLKFNSRVDGKRSVMTLVYPDGKPYPLDITPQSAPETLNAPARKLLSGVYKVRWQVLAADGHITRGEFPFTIR